jgi:RNA polymerase sigma-70 factor (ECF subfamily)
MVPQQFTSQDITKLIARVSLKDRAAFDLLYRATNAKLFGVCLRVLSDRAEAEEALQEVFVKVWTKADRFVVSELSPISWFVAIARNHAIERIRARGQRSHQHGQHGDQRCYEMMCAA